MYENGTNRVFYDVEDKLHEEINFRVPKTHLSTYWLFIHENSINQIHFTEGHKSHQTIVKGVFLVQTSL